LKSISAEISPDILSIHKHAQNLEHAAPDLDYGEHEQTLQRILLAAKGLVRCATDLMDHRNTIFNGGQADLAAAGSKMRHDLRNAVGVLKGYLELLIEDIEEALLEIPEAVSVLLAKAASLQDRINTVVTFDELEIPAIDENEAAALLSRSKTAVRIKGAETEEESIKVSGNVLVVDDSKANRDLICDILRRDGHKVDKASNGSAALKKLRSKSFDVVLLDLMMPGLSGFEVMQQMRKNAALRNVRIVVISGLDQEENAIKSLSMGAEDYLPKPVNPVLLRARLGASLARKHWHDQERLYRMQLQAEKSRSEALLLNTLPASMVKRLVAGEKVIADGYDNVSVLFSDFVGFTTFSDSRDPAEVVEVLNSIFTEFDDLASDLGVEKIKTIGDGYLAVAGLPIPREDHAELAADMALGMVGLLNSMNQRFSTGLEMRIGIHTGPVVAGVIGSHKFTYDVWGNTVNVAARHESYSLPQHIHVSEKTASLLENNYNLTSRGQMTMRGVGEVTTFFLDGRKADTSAPVILEQKFRKGALSVLVADDDLGILELMSRRIQKWGWQATVVTNGKEALKVLKENRFDLLITDCDMPEVNGFELATQIREYEKKTGRHKAIIAVTGNDSDECTSRCFDVGMDAIILKPVMWNELQACIERVCTEITKDRGLPQSIVTR